jgi:RpiR family carbohydrate utilization transcriptional regulator
VSGTLLPTAGNRKGLEVASGKVVALVRGLLPSLVPSEMRVARFVVEHPAEVIHYSVTELAGIAQTSASTVMRFCQKLGFKGYQDFKIALAQEAILPLKRLQSDVVETDSPAEILDKVVLAATDAVAAAAKTIDGHTFGRVVDLFDAADRILVLGVGSSAPIVQDIAYRLLTIGLRTEAPPDVHVQHVAASLLSGRDVCLAISHTGSTRETLAAVRSAALAGAKTIAVTSFFQSPLTEIADVSLVTGSKETAFRVEAMASRLAHLSVLDALFVALAVRNRERAFAAQNAYGVVLAEHRL